MPTYEYQCTDPECNHKFEFMQKMSEDPIEFCPHCGQKSLKKIPSISNFILKGGGWFKKTLKPKTKTKKDDNV